MQKLHRSYKSELSVATEGDVLSLCAYLRLYLVLSRDIIDLYWDFCMGHTGFYGAWSIINIINIIYIDYIFCGRYIMAGCPQSIKYISYRLSLTSFGDVFCVFVITFYVQYVVVNVPTTSIYSDRVNVPIKQSNLNWNRQPHYSAPIIHIGYDSRPPTTYLRI